MRVIKLGILDKITNPVIEQGILGSMADIVCLDAKSEKDLPDSIADFDAVFVFNIVTLSAGSIDKLKKCKLIVRAGVGFDSIDYKYAGSKGIPVVNVPDYGTNDVADHTLALLLAYVRKISLYNNDIQNDPIGGWTPNKDKGIRRLTGKTFGIIGLGRIGAAVASRAKAFGMDVIFYDPYLSEGYDKTLLLEKKDRIEDLIKLSDVISVHVPLNDKTQGLVNYGLLRITEKSPILINTSRGKIVELDSVFQLIKENKIEAFLSDVCETEPPDVDNKLIKAYKNKEDWVKDRLIFTPHVAAAARESQNEMSEKAAINLKEYFCRNILRNCVNEEFIVGTRPH